MGGRARTEKKIAALKINLKKARQAKAEKLHIMRLMQGENAGGQ